MLKNLVSVLKKMSSLSIAPEGARDEADMKAFMDVKIIEESDAIKISGIDEYFKEDYFIIDANNIADIKISDGCDNYFKDVYLYFKDSSWVCIESF